MHYNLKTLTLVNKKDQNASSGPKGNFCILLCISKELEQVLTPPFFLDGDALVCLAKRLNPYG
jgi:hypothetical protein